MALSQAESARRAKPFIEKHEPFRIGDLFSCQYGPLYVVYSYGKHYPLFLYNSFTNTWYENMTRYSHTTSARHKYHARPEHVALSAATTASLQILIRVLGKE